MLWAEKIFLPQPLAPTPYSWKLVCLSPGACRRADRCAVAGRLTHVFVVAGLLNHLRRKGVVLLQVEGLREVRAFHLVLELRAPLFRCLAEDHGGCPRTPRSGQNLRRKIRIFYSSTKQHIVFVRTVSLRRKSKVPFEKNSPLPSFVLFGLSSHVYDSLRCLALR